MKRNSRSIFLLAAIAALSVATFGQTKQQPRKVIVNGQSGTAEVIDQSGRLFLDVLALASIGKGSVSFSGTDIVLAFPPAVNAPKSAAEAPAAPPRPANKAALSQEFMKAGIEEIASVREWATTLASAIRGNYNVTDEWVNGYRDQAAQSLQLADASATTDGDRNAAQVLHRGFDLVQQWSDKLLADKKSMDTAKYTTSPNALRDDPLAQRIIACGRFLTQMLGSAMFQDDPSCR